jgi:hypothetical protein
MAFLRAAGSTAPVWSQPMLSMLLVFAHLLAASTALGAIVATDLRLLSKLAQDRMRIAPPNEFVARIVIVALFVLYATGGAIVWHGLLERADYLANPKLQAKLLLVVLLTINAFVLHRLTFPRLARGRRVARWHASDWIAIGIPVGASNFLWMFVAFLGVARAWNDSMPLRDILVIAAVLYVIAQSAVFAILTVAASGADATTHPRSAVLRRWLASLGNLGRAPAPAGDEDAPPRARRAPAFAAAAVDDARAPASSPAEMPADRPEAAAAPIRRRSRLHLVDRVEPSLRPRRGVR